MTKYYEVKKEYDEKIQSGASSRAKHGDAYFSAV